MTHPLLAQEMLNWACLWVAIAICQNVKYDLIIFIWKLWCSYCYFIKRETSPFKVSVVEFSLFRTMTNYLHLWGSISIWNWRKLNFPWRDGTGEWQNSKVSRMVGLITFNNFQISSSQLPVPCIFRETKGKFDFTSRVFMASFLSRHLFQFEESVK